MAARRSTSASKAPRLIFSVHFRCGGSVSTNAERAKTEDRNDDEQSEQNLACPWRYRAFLHMNQLH